jgi:predicted nuclease with RNAse H fold
MTEIHKLCLGVDVSESHGLDVVLLDAAYRIVASMSRASLSDLGRFIQKYAPDAVAIDAPPCRGRSGGSRDAEKALRRLGIQSYGTPSDLTKREHKFYRWMRRGMEAFDLCVREGYLRYVGGDPRKTVMEVFPHATTVVLAGGLPPQPVSKRDWRKATLEAQGVAAGALPTIDLIDAALAALTGIHALRGEACVLGDPGEGVIVLPCSTPPSRPFRRLQAPRLAPVRPHLPHLAPCACGDPQCHELTDA